MAESTVPIEAGRIAEVGDTGAEIVSDGRTVWVTAPDGTTIARFGRLGVDVHTADGAACLHCTHRATTPEDWETFKGDMVVQHGVTISDIHRPKSFAGR